MSRFLPTLLATGLCMALLSSCGNSKPATTSAPAPTAEPTIMRSGTVMLGLAKEGCPLLIRLDPQKSGEVLIPIGLDERYWKEGMQLKFSYRVSRASSGACKQGTPAIIEDISVIGQVQVPKSNLPTE
jgi:hypothetical protein